MALFKSQVLTQASGSVGGLTYTRTPSGMVIRGRSMPVNPRTERQMVVRNAMGTLSNRWVEVLTDEQRQIWRDYAANVARKNRLGDQIHLSGIAEYQRSNVPRLQAGLTVIDEAPYIYDSGEPLAGFSITQDNVTPFVVEASWLPSISDGTVLIYVSKPQNQSINFFKGPYQLNVQAPVGAPTPTGLIPNPLWQTGQVIFVRAQVSYDDGRLSPDVNARFVLVGTPA